MDTGEPVLRRAGNKATNASWGFDHTGKRALALNPVDPGLAQVYNLETGEKQHRTELPGRPRHHTGTLKSPFADLVPIHVYNRNNGHRRQRLIFFSTRSGKVRDKLSLPFPDEVNEKHLDVHSVTIDGGVLLVQLSRKVWAFTSKPDPATKESE